MTNLFSLRTTVGVYMLEKCKVSPKTFLKPAPETEKGKIDKIENTHDNTWSQEDSTPERQHTHLSQQIPASQNNLTCFRLASRFSNIPVTFESTWLKCMFCNISDCFRGKDYTRPISHRETLSSADFLNSQVSRSATLIGRESLTPTPLGDGRNVQKAKKSPEPLSGKELKCPHLEEKEGKAQAEKWLERRKGWRGGIVSNVYFKFNTFNIWSHGVTWSWSWFIQKT